MLSENSSLQEGFDYPDTNKQLEFTNQQIEQRFKRKINGESTPYDQIDQQKQQIKNQNKLYFKIQVIKKVGTFLENLKAGIVLEKPNLKMSELYYLQSQTKLDQKQNLIKYQSTWVILLQTLLFMFLCANLWKNSYELVFSELISNPYMQLITLGFYLVHIYLFLNTEFKNQKMEIVSNKKFILYYYINERLLYDFFIIVGLALQSTPLDDYQATHNLFRVSTILFLKPISEISKKLETIMSTSTDTEIILSIMSLFFKILLLLHSLSLLLTTVSKIQKFFGITETWVDGNNLQISNDIQQYIAGWYWASTVLSTVGFGDITPVNHVERAFVSFIQVLGCIMSGFFVNFIGSLINMVGQSKKNYQRDMRKVNRYLSKEELPDTLKTNVRSHFFNKYKIEQVYDPTTEETILSKLSNNLSSLITETRNLRLLTLSKFITPFSQQTIKKLSMVAKKMVFAPEQVIFSQKITQKKLWILQDGVVEQIPTFFNSKQDKAIAVYDTTNTTNERTIGWINFLTDKRYKTEARVKAFTLSYEINQDDFFRILREKEQDFNKLHELKQTLIQKKRQYINKCLSCHRFTHNVIDCPRIHFKSRGIFKILIKQKKQQFFKCQQRKKNANRSKSKLNWKSFQSFSQITPQIEGIIAKFSLRSEFDEQNQRRSSIGSLSNKMYRNKSSNYNYNIEIEKRQSGIGQSLGVSRQVRKFSNADLILEINQLNIQKTPITNLIDKVYLGEANGYMQNHNFNEISKKYVLYMINLCTNKNKMMC